MPYVRRPLTPLALTIILLALAAPAAAQSAENVAVVINENSDASRRIGDHYVRARGIPAANVVRIHAPTEEAIERGSFSRSIEQPIATALARAEIHDRILFLVLTKGMPLRILGTEGLQGTAGSVDSELTLLYRRMTGRSTAIRGRIDNPYFLGDRPIGEATGFTHRDHDIFLVTRLDAFTEAEAMQLVDRAGAPERTGRIVLDQRDALTNRAGEDWLSLAAERLATEGHADRVVLETTVKPARGVEDVLGYYAWGSIDPQNRVRRVEMDFVPGSIAASFVSSDARTFKEPPADWVPSDPMNRRTWFEGSGQTLIGDLIRDGVTGVAGHVADPFLQSSVRPQILFSAYLAGFTLAEAFYLATPHLGWHGVIVGDPLCAPFPRQRLTRKQIEGGRDDVTLLPAFFSKRRVAEVAANSRGAPERAVALAISAEALNLRGDREGARKALEAATELAPDVVTWHVQIASIDDQAGRKDAAIERYRRVLELDPNHVATLNNLAYALAEHRGIPAEALPFARRAFALFPRDPLIMDTLGWIEHLLGNHPSATKLLGDAAKLAPNNAEVRLHAAFAFAASEAPAVAEIELNEALRIDPSLAERENVRALRERIEALKQHESAGPLSAWSRPSRL